MTYLYVALAIAACLLAPASSLFVGVMTALYFLK